MVDRPVRTKNPGMRLTCHWRSLLCCEGITGVHVHVRQLRRYLEGLRYGPRTYPRPCT